MIWLNGFAAKSQAFTAPTRPPWTHRADLGQHD
jgi:hypothetical protein